MKLIVAIVDDKDVDKVMTALTGQRIGVTYVSSTGGFITPGNSTLLIGLEESLVSQAITAITELAAPRQAYVPYTYTGNLPAASFAEVPVGGYQSFVLDVVHFEQV